MSTLIESATPGHRPPLDRSFRPAAVANRLFRAAVAAPAGGVPLVLGLERSPESISRFETTVLPDGHPRAGENLWYADWRGALRLRAVPPLSLPSTPAALPGHSARILKAPRACPPYLLTPVP